MAISRPRSEAFLSSPAFAKALGCEDGRAAKAHLAAGRPIYYSDERYPGHVIKKFPDGRKQLIVISRTRQETVIRDL
ncbi:MAG: hypothetical protein ACYDEV_12815 [Acidiferrobacter sp.]